MRDTAFVALIDSPTAKKYIRLFIASLRSFGGSLAAAPVWLFQDTPDVPCSDMTEDLVRVEPLNTPVEIRSYPLGSKVFTCARAEEMMTTGITTMIWCNPECLVVQPADLLHLDNPFKAAVRPVHIRNVGSLHGEPLDAYWRAIYQTAAVRDTSPRVESFVDQQVIRPYFNTHIFAIDPSHGICAHWLEAFTRLVQDRDFQNGPCSDEPHQIFLHQAVFSAVLLKLTGFDRIRILPPTYSYPYHLQEKISTPRRVNSLNNLVVVVYEEDHPLDPRTCTDITIYEPLKTWLMQKSI